jgi:hypothetical protein
MFQQVDIDLKTDSDLLKSIKVEGDIPHGEELKPWVRLSKVFMDGLEDEHLHIIVKHPTGMWNHGEMLDSPLTIFCHPRQNSCSFPTAGYPVPTRSNADTSSALCPEFPQHGAFQPGSAFGIR